MAADDVPAESPLLLLDLTDDVLVALWQALCDPLRPLAATHFASAAKGVWAPLKAQLAELRSLDARHRQRHSAVDSRRSPSFRSNRLHTSYSEVTTDDH